MKLSKLLPGLLALVVFNAACAQNGKHIDPEEALKKAAEAARKVRCYKDFLFDADKLKECLNGKANATPTAPTPDPRATAPTATATATPSPTGPASPTATTAPTQSTERLMPTAKVAATCVPQTAATPNYFKDVRTAFSAYKAQHPEQFQDGGNHMLFPSDWNSFYAGVVRNLRKLGYEAVVDDCSGEAGPICQQTLCPEMICGEIVVAKGGTLIGTGFSEGYHILTSGGDVRDPIYGGGYRGTCTPKWF